MKYQLIKNKDCFIAVDICIFYDYSTYCVFETVGKFNKIIEMKSVKIFWYRDIIAFKEEVNKLAEKYNAVILKEY